MAKRHNPRPTLNIENTQSFSNPEETWFWYWTCINSKKLGNRGGADTFSTPRTCEVSDICRIIKKLYKSNFLNREHLQIMALFGKKMTVPNVNFGHSKKQTTLWQEAMGIFAIPLKQKGIIL